MPMTHSLTGLMNTKRMESLRDLAGVLRSDPIQTRDQFGDFMKAAFVMGQLSQQKLADDKGLSISTIYRWCEGRSAPHPSLWPVIVEWARDEIEAIVRQHDAEQARLAESV